MNLAEHLDTINKSTIDLGLKGFSGFDSWSQILFQITYEYLHLNYPDEYPEKIDNKSSIYQSISRLINKNCEPSFSLGPYWQYAPICQSLVLISQCPALYEMFSDLEKQKIHQLMKMFAYNWNLGCNTENNYGTGVDRTGNYGKWRGPNYRLANIGLIFPIMQYFGGEEKLNQLFLSYDYDTEMKQLRQFNFRNCLRAWSTETIYSNDGKRVLGAKELTMNGGTAYIQSNNYGIINTYWRGEGKGVRTPYAFKDKYPYGIIHFLYNNCFYGGVCKTNINTPNFISGTLDGTTSPFEGEEGMMLEFNLENDGQGIRTSLFYTSVDFLLIVQLATFLELTKISKLKDYKNLRKVWIGMEDYIYKKEHGYKGFRLGHEDIFRPVRMFGLEAWIEYWKTFYHHLVEF